jgi:hypothetical protein
MTKEYTCKQVVDNQKQQSETTEHLLPEYLSRHEAANYLQERGIPATYSWLSRNAGHRIPFLKIGKVVRYKRSELDSYIENSRLAGSR